MTTPTGAAASTTGQIDALLIIAQRDLTKLWRDRPRLVVTLIFPMLFILGLNGALGPVLGRVSHTSTLSVLFTGVLAATLFQSAASGMISLLEDRENDFTRELFVAPVSRVTIVAGKVIGESLVALVQGVGIVVFALVLGVHAAWQQLAWLIPPALLACLYGASFGLAALAVIPNQRVALQVVPFFILPQYFLAGVMAPVQALSPALQAVSRAMPLTYSVGLTRAVFYASAPGGSGHPAAFGLDLGVMASLSILFLLLGAFMFDRRERIR